MPHDQGAITLDQLTVSVTLISFVSTWVHLSGQTSKE